MSLLVMILAILVFLGLLFFGRVFYTYSKGMYLYRITCIALTPRYDRTLQEQAVMKRYLEGRLFSMEYVLNIAPSERNEIEEAMAQEYRWHRS